MRVAISVPLGSQLTDLSVSGETIKDVLDRLPYANIASIRFTPNACCLTGFEDYLLEKHGQAVQPGREPEITVAHSEGSLDASIESSYLSKIEMVVDCSTHLVIFDNGADPAIKTITGQAYRSGVKFKKILMSDMKNKFTTTDILNWFDRELPF